MRPLFSISFCLLFLCLLAGGCGDKPEKKPVGVSFLPVKGIRFYEVKRKLGNGLSFHKSGFQLEPSWILEFKSNDSVAAWSPQRYQWFNFPVLFDHDSVYNFVREFFRIKHISKDSLVLQRLEVKSLEVMTGEASDLFMTFYSKDYIFNTLHSNPGELQKPTMRDSAFVRRLAEKSNRNPLNVDSAFGARQPVQFLPVSKVVSVTKTKATNSVTNDVIAEDYLYPEYTININRAYKDFVYLASVIVDGNGRMKVTKVHGVLEENVEFVKKTVQGILDVYVKNLFTVVPGTTLGWRHSSEIELYLIGKAIK